jgi:hypothetical protein
VFVSIPVALAELHRRIDEFGAQAFVVTVNGDGSAHVVSVVVDRADDQLVAGAGRRTATNVDRTGAVTVLWPPAGGGEYSLIVDGTATVVSGDEARLAISPTGAVLHKMAGATGDGPGCVPVLKDA